jgi:hypothetical protein
MVMDGERGKMEGTRRMEGRQQHLSIKGQKLVIN